MKKFLALALALSGCLLNSGSHANKFGLIRASCGPADGPATEIQLTDSEAVCGNHPMVSRVGSINGTSIKDLKLGYDYADIPLSNCGIDCSFTTDTLSIKFTDSTGMKMRGTYEIMSGGKTKETGSFDFNKCEQTVIFCG